MRAAQRLQFARSTLADVGVDLDRASLDAGFRSYWRTRGGSLSCIVMDAPPGIEDVRPWLAVHALLAAGGVRVPEVLARDLEAGFLLLEDLGAQTLLQRIDESTALDWFDAAINQLIALQRIMPPAWLPHYDEPLLRRELALFEDWLLGRELGLHDDAGAGATLAASSRFLVEAALAQPTVLVHRDFMPRNLMPLASGGLAVLDFQDAVCGPISYDALCLFKDAFITWPAALVDEGLQRYHRRAREAGLPVPGFARFRRDVDLIGIQRHLKVLGIFARLKHRDGKPQYLADAPRFVAYLLDVLPNYPALAPLQDLVAQQVLPAFERA